MIYLILGILSSSAIAIAMRLSNGKAKYGFSMLAINYLTCIVLGCAYTGFDNIFPAVPSLNRTLLLGGIDGIVYISSLSCMNLCTKKNGVVLTNVFSRLGLIVSLVVSVVFFRERPTWMQGIGIALAAVGMVVINLQPDSQADSKRAIAVPLLFLDLLLDGLAAVMSKVYQVLGDAKLGDHFVLYTFMAALAICIVVVIVRRERFGLYEIIFGIAIGVPNFYASRVLLSALHELPAVIVYPTRGVMCIVLVTLLGVAFFRERLKKHQWAAMAAILGAVVLLNI